jgi:hypothetical protein
MRSTVGAMLGLVSAVLAAGASDLSLPGDLAAYRSWKSPSDGPVEITPEASALCAPAPLLRGEAQLPSKRQGHGSPFIRVYANEAAFPRLAAPTPAVPVPVGAVIAKEKLASAEGRAAAVAFMVKRDDPRFRPTGGWEFSFFPDAGDRTATHEACAACHRTAQAGDYVFAHVLRR